MDKRASWIRLLSSLAAGLVVAGVLAGQGAVHAVVAGWITTSAVFSVWTWATIRPMDAAQTHAHATREDPSRVTSSLVLLTASVASLLGVGMLLFVSSNRAGTVPLEALLGVASVVGSWCVVHLVYTLHYAKLYYEAAGAGGPIDFNSDEAPDYQDFAYLAFTLGMTYQVSDTALKDRRIRRAALRHGLLSFLLGAVVVAVTLNLVVQLAS